MADLNKAITGYVRDVIALPKGNISDAAKSREWFLKRIANEIGARRNEPTLYIQQPFVYYGSYFKRTKVASVDEYDVLVVIDSNSGVFNQSGRAIGAGVGAAAPNHKYDSRFMKEDGSGVSPAKLLNWLKGVAKEVVDAFGGETPEREGEAVTARILSQNLRIDLVPAGVFTHAVTGETFYDIPRGDRANGWILTAPQTDIKRLNTASEKRNDFRNVIRIAKRIRDRYNFLVKSFAIEAAVVNYAYQYTWYNELARDTLNVLEYLATAFRAKLVTDPFDNSNNLIADVAQLEWYAERLHTVVEEISKCASMLDQTRADERVRRVLDNE